MTKHIATIEPKASRTTKFRVPINFPEAWKIQSIANHKKAIMVKKKQSEELKQLATSSAPAIAPPNLARSASFEQRARSMSMDERSNYIEKKRNTISTDQIKRELEVLHKNSNIISGKVHSLSVVRSSLIWLMKKAILCERAEIC